MDHLDSAAGKAKGHPPQRTRAGPLKKIFGAGDKETLVLHFAVQLVIEPCIGRRDFTLPARSPVLAGRVLLGIADHSHSSAPTFQA